MQVGVAESRNGKLDHQFLFSIHFDLRDRTVSISSYLGHLRKKDNIVGFIYLTGTNYRNINKRKGALSQTIALRANVHLQSQQAASQILKN